jgi:Peptidase family M23.
LAEGIKDGSEVKKGQVIAFVGQLEGSKNSMLHFELYSGTGKGGFTVPDNQPYKRRSDLIDPTETLDKAQTVK